MLNLLTVRFVTNSFVIFMIFFVFCVPCSILMQLKPCFLPWQNGLSTKVEKSRKQMKERKNRAKKIRGVKKVNLMAYDFKCLCTSICFNFCLLPCTGQGF